LDGVSPRFTSAYLGGWRNRIEKKSSATRVDHRLEGFPNFFCIAVTLIDPCNTVERSAAVVER
jgi:hypothetical protein